MKIINRHEILGIKQAIRLEWMQKISDLVLEGKGKDQIRDELKEYLSNRMGRGVFEKRSETACNFSISMLMKIWVIPDKDLLSFRDEGLKLLQSATEEEKIAIHFCMLSATYPFWYNVSRHIGTLLRLQEKITISQILKRIKECYGDRGTVDRNARFVIRSLYYWNLLYETDVSGCYQIGEKYNITSDTVNSWIIEAQLNSIPEGKAILSSLSNDVALFSFNTGNISGITIDKYNPRIEVLQSGMNDMILILN